jgi:hypothetical protein
MNACITFQSPSLLSFTYMYKYTHTPFFLPSRPLSQGSISLTTASQSPSAGQAARGLSLSRFRLGGKGGEDDFVGAERG